MKKSTKKTLMALVIILTFGLSSLAFVATNIIGSNQNQFKQLESPIVEGELDPIYESTYVQHGFTWVKYYYAEPDQSFLNFIDSLPQTFTTPAGGIQLIVQKINERYLNETNYIAISSQNGQENFAEKDINKIFGALCRLLTLKPLECGFANMTEANSSIFI